MQAFVLLFTWKIQLRWSYIRILSHKVLSCSVSFVGILLPPPLLLIGVCNIYSCMTDFLPSILCVVSKYFLLWFVAELHSMSMKLVSSGSYNVRASEMAHLQDRQPKTVNCVVHFLDDTEETFEIDVRIGCHF